MTRPVLEPIGHNMLTMWRCVICMAHADGIVSPEERTYLTGVFQKMEERRGLTADQKKILLDDLEHPQDAGLLLAQINDPVYRSQVIDFARILAYKDGLHPSEEVLLKKLHADVMQDVDLDRIRAQVHGSVLVEMRHHDVEMSKHRPQYSEGWGIGAYVDDILLRLGIDLMDK